MRHSMRWLPFLFLAGAGCDAVGPLPTEPPNTEALAIRLAAGSSGCYTVAFNVMLVPIGPGTFEGAVTGDLEGTVTLQFDGSFKATGKTVAASGTASWMITGGIVPVPLVFTTAFDNRNLVTDRPGSPATLFENIGTHRALGGVEKANLHYKGTFTLVPVPLADHDYRGVICT